MYALSLFILITKIKVMNKKAKTSVEIDSILASRWSPRSFDGTDIKPDDILRLQEAARWSPSSFNEQPWRYIIAARNQWEAFNIIINCFLERNIYWSRQASLVGLVFASKVMEANDSVNLSAHMDVGLATASIIYQAESLGYKSHLLGGIDRKKVKKTYTIPTGFDILCGLVIGKQIDDIRMLDESHRKMEVTERTRKELNEIFFFNSWGKGYVPKR